MTQFGPNGQTDGQTDRVVFRVALQLTNKEWNIQRMKHTIHFMNLDLDSVWLVDLKVFMGIEDTKFNFGDLFTSNLLGLLVRLASFIRVYWIPLSKSYMKVATHMMLSYSIPAKQLHPISKQISINNIDTHIGCQPVGSWKCSKYFIIIIIAMYYICYLICPQDSSSSPTQ